MAPRRRDHEGRPALSQPEWRANYDEVARDLDDIDPITAADLTGAMKEFFQEYYPPGLTGRDLRLRQNELRRRWRVKEARAAEPEKVWEFRPEQGSDYRVLFGESPAVQEVLFLGIAVKARGERAQTQAMRRAAARLRRLLGR